MNVYEIKQKERFWTKIWLLFSLKLSVTRFSCTVQPESARFARYIAEDSGD